MTEFANFTTQGMPNGYSSRGGFIKSAYSCDKDPGGSSTGSAVAVSAGFCSMAVGTDTSFSIIACATENGISGLKPSIGSLSNKGIIPISHTLDSAGPLARDFESTLLLFSGMKDKPLSPIKPVSPKELKIAVNIFNKDIVSSEQLARYEKLFDVLKTEGVNFYNISHPTSPYLKTIMQCEFKQDLEEYLCCSTAKLKTLKDIVRYYETNSETMMKYGISSLYDAMGKSMNDTVYKEAIRERKELRRQIIDELQNYDACVMTGPTNIMHFTGIPSVALRLCMGDDEHPRGIILYGTDEQRLFAAAITIEKYCSSVSLPRL